MPTWGTGISLKGARGEAGLGIIFGSGRPADDLVGQPRQLYVDTTAEYLDAYVFGFDDVGNAADGWNSIGWLRGAMGVNGMNVRFYYGREDPNTESPVSGGNQEALYLQSDGTVWIHTGDGIWSRYINIKGADGLAGKDGVRGSQRFIGDGPPPEDPSMLTNGNVTGGAVAGDEYVDRSSEGGPYVYYYT